LSIQTAQPDHDGSARVQTGKGGDDSRQSAEGSRQRRARTIADKTIEAEREGDRGQISDDRGQQTDQGQRGARTIRGKIVEAERKRDFKLSEFYKFRFRTRYFIDSGIIGSREFVERIYQRFKHHFLTEKEKRPKAIKGLEGVYSLKNLSELI